MKITQLLLIIIFIIFCNNIFAQNYDGAEVIIGVKGGVSLSTGSFLKLDGSTPKQNTYYHRLGGYGGAVFRYSGEKYLAFQVEANFMQRGFQQFNDFWRTFNYIEIPLLAHVFVGAKKFRWFVNLGPEVSFMINEISFSSSTNDDTKVLMTEPIKSRFDYGLNFGTGFEIHTKAGIYQLEGRYELGFGDFFAASPADNFLRAANRNITMTLGWLINIKQKPRTTRTK
ncbi:MAG: PorT family protein [Prevotellaceae bacterium]|nr:PorT family protein [Prevotellaceae bacterium]